MTFKTVFRLLLKTSFSANGVPVYRYINITMIFIMCVFSRQNALLLLKSISIII